LNDLKIAQSEYEQQAKEKYKQHDDIDP